METMQDDQIHTDKIMQLYMSYTFKKAWPRKAEKRRTNIYKGPTTGQARTFIYIFSF